MLTRKILFAAFLWLGWALLGASAASASTLDTVKARGYLQCGVSTGLAGFSFPDEKGRWKGFDADYCRAVAAAIFGNGERVKFIPLSSKERFTALQSGDIDVLIRNTGWTMARDTGLGLTAAAINYYDGQGFMVNVKNLPGISSIADLSGAAICVQSGTSTELTLADYFRRNNLDYKPVVFEKFSEVNAAYDAGRCDAYTTDQSSLYAVRLQLANPQDNAVLPQIITKEPFALIVRQNDTQWLNIVRWTHNALVNAEEYGIRQDNLDAMLKSANPDVKRLLGTEDGTNLGANMGLAQDWAVNIIRATGNYGEIFDRNVGLGSALKIARGINDLWTKGGLHYGIPVR